MRATELVTNARNVSALVKGADLPEEIKRILAELVALAEAQAHYQVVFERDRLVPAEEALQELIDGDMDVLTSETAQKLLQPIIVGRSLCQILEAVINGALREHVDDIQRANVRQAIGGFVTVAKEAEAILVEISSDDIDDDEDDTDDDEDADDDDVDGEESDTDDESDDDSAEGEEE